MNMSRFLSIFFRTLEKIWLEDISSIHSEQLTLNRLHPIYTGTVAKTLINLQTCQIWSLVAVRELSHNE